MARGTNRNASKHTTQSTSLSRPEVEPDAQSVADTVRPVSDGPRTFRVRCVDPTLRGYSVRGVHIPPGGEVLVTVAPKHVQDVLRDRALEAIEVDP